MAISLGGEGEAGQLQQGGDRHITVSWPLAAAHNWPLYANNLVVSPPSDPWIPT